MHSNGGPLDNYETTFWHCICTAKRWKHGTYDPVWDYGQVQCNNTNDTRNEVTSSEILELVACEDFNENISEEIEESANESNMETLLMCILQKLRKQKGKVDWSQVTTADLCSHFIPCKFACLVYTQYCLTLLCFKVMTLSKIL